MTATNGSTIGQDAGQPVLAEIAMKIAEARARVEEHELGRLSRPSRMEAVAIDAALLSDNVRSARRQGPDALRDMAFDGLDAVDDTFEAIKHDQGGARTHAIAVGLLLTASLVAIVVLRRRGARIAAEKAIAKAVA